jgi:hypothetical protein
MKLAVERSEIPIYRGRQLIRLSLTPWLQQGANMTTLRNTPSPHPMGRGSKGEGFF